jgi:hypothetical protein
VNVVAKPCLLCEVHSLLCAVPGRHNTGTHPIRLLLSNALVYTLQLYHCSPAGIDAIVACLSDTESPPP